MISINLRPGAKRAPTGGGPSLAGLGERLKGLASSVKDPMMAGAVGVSALVLVVIVWGFLSTSMQQGRLRPELDEVQQENRRFRTLLGQIRREERIRDSVVTELVTLRQVDSDRYIWPHILEDVSRALPPATWLVRMEPTESGSGGFVVDSLGNMVRAPLRVELTGRTMDIQGFTRFMRQLEDSPWLSEVTAVSATTLIEANRAVTAFVIRVSFQQADSTYVRRVPVAETLRVGGEGR